MPELDDDVPGFGDSLQDFKSRIEAAPLLSSLSGLSSAAPTGGACPSGTASTFIGAIRFDSFCEMAPDVLAPLRVLFLCIWAFAAIRLFFTA
ncbi:hypothetical protein D3C78_904980 [compost metagenome]